MTEKEYAQVIAKNLKRIAYEHDKTQAQIAQELHIHRATISAWMNGTRTPKMSKIDMLCKYFGCTRADIMEPYTGEETPHHHTNPETEQIAQYIYEDSDLRLLFDAARGSDPENLKLAAELLKRMKETNNDG